MNTIKINRGNTRMVAHRGLCGLEPENSIPAFVAAGNRSYYGIESDVRMTADGRFVMLHDDTTKRMTGEELRVSDMPYETIRKIRLRDCCQREETMGQRNGNPGGRQDLIIPNLAEYITVCKKYGKVCVLELKNVFCPEDVKRLIEEIRTLDYLEHVVFISFEWVNLTNLRRFLPEQELYCLVLEWNDKVRTFTREYGIQIDIAYQALSEELVEELHREKLKVNCWTCDSREDARKLASWGVDFITTDILE